MNNYTFLVCYDGSRYEGWQRQTRTAETVQGKLESAFEKLTGEKGQVIGAGRTDAGVHAWGQRANIHLSAELSLPEAEEEINRLLPDDIGISGLRPADERFHARFSAVRKTYRYRIRTGSRKNVFERRYVWQLGEKLDVSAMKAGAVLLEGTHDYTSFCGNKHMKKSAVRTVEQIELTEKDGVLQLDFTGDGFLQNMVRILVGTLVEIGEGKRKAEELPDVLAAGNRARAGFTAPPQGLCLLRVDYGKEWML